MIFLSTFQKKRNNSLDNFMKKSLYIFTINPFFYQKSDLNNCLYVINDTKIFQLLKLIH